MKTLHIKFEILKERINVLYCNLIQHNCVLNMFSIGKICKEKIDPFGDVMDDVIKSLDAAAGKLLNPLFENVCDLIG